MMSFLQLPILFSLLVFISLNTHALAATVGSGRPFSSLIHTPAGILGVDPDGIWLSTDQGANFGNVYSVPGDLYFALAASGSTVVAVGETGLVVRSANGGNTWTQVANPGLFGDLISVANDGNGVWLAAGDFGTSLLRSTDDGQTWTAPTAPSAISLRAIAWHPDTDWILAGEGTTTLSGIIYRSIDNGTTWQLLAGDLTAPINSLAINTAGEITAVGESGLILQGTVSSAFAPPTGYVPVSQSLSTVIATSSGSFLVGGESGTLLGVDGSGVSNDSLIEGPDVTAILVLADDSILISGTYQPPASLVRTLPFELQLSSDPLTGAYTLTVDETLSDRNYRIESSTDLQSWTNVTGSERAGNSGARTWTFPAEGLRLFWRAVEF